MKPSVVDIMDVRHVKEPAQVVSDILGVNQ